MKKGKVLVCLLAAIALAMAIFGCAKAEPELEKAGPVETTAQVSETIVVDLVIDGAKGEDKAINCSSKVELPSGATAYDALKTVCDKEKLEITGDPSYVKTIGGLGEGSFGAKPCGWMFSVDGEYPSASADKFILEDGNQIIWEFTK